MEPKWTPKLKKFVKIRGKFVTFFGICFLDRSGRGLDRLGEGFGRVLDGLGEGFGTVLEGFGRPGGARMETKMREIRGHFATLSQDASRGGFGEDLGRIWGGFCKDLEGFREDFEWNLGRISIEFSKDF